MIAGLLTVGIVMVVLVITILMDRKYLATDATDATDGQTRNTPGKESQ